LTFTFHPFAEPAQWGRFFYHFWHVGSYGRRSYFRSIGQGVRGYGSPKSVVSHRLWMSLLQQCYALTCYTVITRDRCV